MKPTSTDLAGLSAPAAARAGRLQPLYFFSHEPDANQFYALAKRAGCWRSMPAALLMKRCCAVTPANTPEGRSQAAGPSGRSDAVRTAGAGGTGDFRERLARAVEWVLAEQETRVRVPDAPLSTGQLECGAVGGSARGRLRPDAADVGKPFLLEGSAELASEHLLREATAPRRCSHAAYPLVQRPAALPDPDAPPYRPLLTGLYYGALLNGACGTG
ncbi:MAG: hypothetical protein U1F42_02770 [Candidatus Competibacteraceae bacterium]